MSADLHSQVIAEALALLNDQGRWTKGVAARNRAGRACAMQDPGAVRFCAFGAIARAAFAMLGNVKQAQALARSIEWAVLGPHRRLAQINDRHGRDAVMGVLRAHLNHE